MDSITQAALGASIGEAMFGKAIGRKGAITGAIVATIPDLDVILLPFFSDVQRLSIHRGFSHSIVFSIIGALLIGYILSKIRWTKSIVLSQLILFSWLALITHMLLDAFTSYGTQLLLPFSNHRVSFDSINIVDPIYTLPLLIGLFLSVKVYKNASNRGRYNRIGILVSSLYLIFTLGIKSHVNQKFKRTLAANHIEYKSLLTVPVKISSVKWYGVASTDVGLYIGHYNNVSRQPIQLDYFPRNTELLSDFDPLLVEKLKWFAKDYYAVALENGNLRFYNLQCDMQGVKEYGDYKAPTAFYFEIAKDERGGSQLSTGMHKEK
ncbi:MAG: metal-dependent hydrolase [Chitinophagales bacterium]